MPSNSGETEPPHRAGNRAGSRNASAKVGQLLVEAGLLKVQDLEHSLSIAKESKQPVGRILVGFDHVSAVDLEQALKAQTLIANGVINQRTAANALRQASVTNQKLEAILADLGTLKPSTRVGSLSDLLVRAEYISEEAHANATRESLASNLPFGRTLVVTNQISAADLRNALQALFLVTHQPATENHALQALRLCRKEGIDLPAAFKSMRVPAELNNLEGPAEILLLRAGIVSDADYLSSLEIAVASNESVVDVFTAKRFITDDFRQEVEEIGRFVELEVIPQRSGTELIKAARARSERCDHVARTLNVFADTSTQSTAMDFLIDCGILTTATVTKCIETHRPYGMGRSRSLIASRMMKQSFIDAVSECQVLVQRGEITQDEAIRVLKDCQKSGLPLLKALAAQGLALRSVAANVLGQFEEAPHHSLLQTEIMGWIAYPGFFKMAIFALGTPVLSAIILHFVPIHQRGIGFTILFVALIVYFIFDGFLVRENAKVKMENEKDRLASAGDTKSRLLGRKGKK